MAKMIRNEQERRLSRSPHGRQQIQRTDRLVRIFFQTEEVISSEETSEVAILGEKSWFMPIPLFIDIIYIYIYIIYIYIIIIYILLYLYIQVVPGRAGGGSFRRIKNYIAKKEFAYRMCARRPTSAMPKPFLCCERAFCCSMVVM